MNNFQCRNTLLKCLQAKSNTTFDIVGDATHHVISKREAFSKIVVLPHRVSHFQFGFPVFVLSRMATSNEEEIVVDDGVKKEEVSYIMSAPLSGAPRIKQGHKCCGGCCDVRRAAMIVNTINACLNTIAVFGLCQAHIAAHREHFNDDDSSVLTAHPLPFAPMLTWLLVRIVIYIAGAYGGLIYNIWLVGLAVLEYVIDLIFFSMMADIPGAVMVAFFIYPNVIFILEVRKGIMSKETYHNEEYSCCCV